MAGLFMDGMGHYATAQIADKYTAVYSAGATWTIAAEGRTANCLKATVTNNVGGYVSVSPFTDQAGLWTKTVSGACGFAVKVTNLPLLFQGTTGSYGAIWRLFESSVPKLVVMLNQTGTFTAYREVSYPPGTLSILGSSVEGLVEDTWAYVEIKWLLHLTAGYVEVRVNGIVIFRFDGRTATSSDAWYPHTGVWDTVRFFNICGSGVILRACDLYLLDLEGADNNDCLGDITVGYIKPNAVGTSSAWTPSAVVDHYTLVDDVPADDDTTYVEATAAATRDSYGYENIAYDPLMIQVCTRVRKTSDGPATVQPIVRQGGADYDGPAQGIATVADYTYLTQTYDTNPDTSAAFTQAEINGGEFGLLKAS